MTLRRLVIAGLLLVMTMTASAQSQDDTKDSASIYAEESPAILLIRASKEAPNGDLTTESGSGFVVSADGLIITASHVIPDVRLGDHLTIGASFGPDTTQGPTLKLALVRRSDKYDVALLRLVKPPKRLTVARLRASPPKAGEHLYVLGYPLGLPETHILDGIISAVNTSDITTNALVNKGNSGGPILDARGCVMGVIYSGIESHNGEEVAGVKFAVPLRAINDLLPATANPTANVMRSPPAIIHASDSLSRIQTTHGMTDTVTRYDDFIPARPGFTIDAVEAVEKNSLNPPAFQYPIPKITADGSGIILSYTLLSGPFYDQRRGWIDMKIHTRQRARTATPQSIPSRRPCS